MQAKTFYKQIAIVGTGPGPPDFLPKRVFDYRVAAGYPLMGSNDFTSLIFTF